MHIQRWFRRCQRLILAVAAAFALLAFSSGSPAVPVLAASSLAPVAQTAPGSAAELALLVQELMSGSTAYTAEDLAGATEYLLAHPFEGTIEVMTRSQMDSAIQPDLSVGVGWFGVTIHLTNADVVSLFQTIVTYGTAAVAAALCAPGIWLAVVCGFFGAIAGWIIVTIVLQATNNFGGCGLTIFIPWWGHYSWHCG